MEKSHKTCQEQGHILLKKKKKGYYILHKETNSK